MSEIIRNPEKIDGYLRTLRYFDRQAIQGSPRAVMDAILDMHKITVAPSPEDYWRGAEIPLRQTLSLLDDERRRNRVIEVHIG